MLLRVEQHSGRGTGRRKLSDIPEPKERPEYKGTISSGRGVLEKNRRIKS